MPSNRTRGARHLEPSYLAFGDGVIDPDLPDPRGVSVALFALDRDYLVKIGIGIAVVGCKDQRDDLAINLVSHRWVLIVVLKPIPKRVRRG
jgi:hypothetical protein